MENVFSKKTRKSTTIEKPEIKDLAKEYLNEISKLSQAQKIHLIYKNLFKAKHDQTFSIDQVLNRVLYRIKFGKYIQDTKDFLKKKKNKVKSKLSEEKKKYESIKKKLKSGLDDPEEITELKGEMASIINKIDSLVKEYNNLLKLLELKKEDLYVILQILPGFDSSELDSIIDYNEDQLNQSIEREKELKVQLKTALLSVDELKAEIEDMDETFQTQIRMEHERLHGKLKADREREFKEKVKNFKNEEILKIDKKYNKLLKKQEEKYQKKGVFVSFVVSR